MDILIWLIVGSMLGRLASWVLETHDVREIIFNVAVGASGALLGGWVLTPWVDGGLPHPTGFHSTAVALALIGAAVLIGILSVLRNDTTR